MNRNSLLDTAQTRHGKMTFFANDMVIGRSLRAYGEWAENEISLLKMLIPLGGTVIDAGAYIGTHTLAFSRFVGPEGMVISIEPQVKSFQTLQINVMENRCSNVKLEHAAAGDRIDNIEIPMIEIAEEQNFGMADLRKAKAQHVIGSTNASDRPEAEAIRMLTIDSLELKSCSLLKIDVEGFEDLVIRGALQTIKRFYPVIYAECNSIQDGIKSYEAMKEIGYEIYMHVVDAFNQNNYFCVTENIFGEAREAALLAVHSSEATRISRLRSRPAEIFLNVKTADDLVFGMLQKPQYFEEVLRVGAAAKSGGQLVSPSALNAANSRAIAAEKNAEQLTLALRHRNATIVRKDAEIASADKVVANISERYAAINRSRLKSRKLSRAKLLDRSPIKVSEEALDAIRSSVFFDAKFYLDANPDVKTARIDPALHYLLLGGLERRNPGPLFSTIGYLDRNPDVTAAEMNALQHYELHGRGEGRKLPFFFSKEPVVATHPDSVARSKVRTFRSFIDELVHAPFRLIRGNRADRVFLRDFKKPRITRFRPPAPDWSQFESIAAQRMVRTPPTEVLVDVIIPVYRGYADTFACILSVLQSDNITPFDLIVVDDCSPEPDVSRDLERLEQMGLIKLLKNETNLGFVGSVNFGMDLHPDRDVLLLNNDTLVFGNWLDRLRTHASENVSTVTPFTNNGTICSYPKFCSDNPQELEIGFDIVDQLAAKVNPGHSVDVPTGVGFCMYITRRSLADTGTFDQATFGKGYGEENDFCMRASKRGWRNVHALDTFVFHSGETSFGHSASESKQRGYAAVTNKHPDYEELVWAFISRDPARYARIALDVARGFGRPPTSTVLYVSHTWGGGIQRYIDDRAAQLRGLNRDLLIAVPTEPGTSLAQLVASNGAFKLAETARFDLASEPETLRLLFRALAIDKIEVHSTAGWASTALSALSNISRICHIPYTVMLHDYIFICPKINLINETGLYCGETGPDQCATCLSHARNDAPVVHLDLATQGCLDIQHWRALYGDFLKGATQVLAPSQDTAMRVNRYFNGIAINVLPHNEDIKYTVRSPLPTRYSGRLRVAVIGAIGRPKGFDVLCSCAKDAKSRKLPLEFVVVGYTCDDEVAKSENIKITGRYKESEVYDLLAAEQPQMAFLPSVWPETYSYTLSIAMAAGLPIAVFDIGAQAERLRSEPAGLLLTLDMARRPDLINEAILRFGDSIPRH